MGVWCVCMVHKDVRLGDALRLLLRPLWDKNRAIVATWLVEYCIQCSAVHTHFLSQLTSTNDGWWNSMQKILKICQKTIKLQDVYRLPIHHGMYTLYASIRKIVWHQPVQLLLHCRRWNTKATTSELSNAWNSNLFKHIFMRHSFITAAWMAYVWSAFIRLSSMNKQGAYLHSNSFGQQWFPVAVKLVDHLQNNGSALNVSLGSV